MKSKLLKKLCQLRADSLVKQRLALASDAGTVEGGGFGRPPGHKFEVELHDGQVVALKEGGSIALSSVNAVLCPKPKQAAKIRRLAKKIEFWRTKENSF